MEKVKTEQDITKEIEILTLDLHRTQIDCTKGLKFLNANSDKTVNFKYPLYYISKKKEEFYIDTEYQESIYQYTSCFSGLENVDLTKLERPTTSSEKTFTIERVNYLKIRKNSFGTLLTGSEEVANTYFEFSQKLIDNAFTYRKYSFIASQIYRVITVIWAVLALMKGMRSNTDVIKTFAMIPKKYLKKFQQEIINFSDRYVEDYFKLKGSLYEGSGGQKGNSNSGYSYVKSFKDSELKNESGKLEIEEKKKNLKQASMVDDEREKRKSKKKVKTLKPGELDSLKISQDENNPINRRLSKFSNMKEDISSIGSSSPKKKKKRAKLFYKKRYGNQKTNKTGKSQHGRAQPRYREAESLKSQNEEEREESQEKTSAMLRKQSGTQFVALCGTFVLTVCLIAFSYSLYVIEIGFIENAKEMLNVSKLLGNTSVSIGNSFNAMYQIISLEETQPVKTGKFFILKKINF